MLKSQNEHIAPGEAAKLIAAGVITVEQLWLRISEEQDNGIQPICKAANINEDRLIELLTAEGLRPTGRYGTGWLKEHWPDLIVILSLLALVALFWRSR